MFSDIYLPEMNLQSKASFAHIIEARIGINYMYDEVNVSNIIHNVVNNLF